MRTSRPHVPQQAALDGQFTAGGRGQYALGSTVGAKKQQV
jgi:hypothetical protein